ncbi:unnamed protein product [Phytophthora fragariaefolia]|uniref:Unnamed protein product n=1 Tax=Phytophthora fragariaefolia TaxID=1490495 RepID=A0A9W6UEE2_9STRA|nr:unnamed protein product [Phytophthora fragariaefolia]
MEKKATITGCSGEASNAQRGAARASSGRSRRRFVPRDDSSEDDSGEDDYYRNEDAEYDDPSDKLAPQVREVSEMERLNSTPRLDLATHRPLAQIKAFSGLRLERRLCHLRVKDIHELEDIINDILKSEERSSTRETSAYLSRGRDRSHGRDERYAETSRDGYRRDRHDRHGRGYDRRMDDSCHTHPHDRHVAATNDAERTEEWNGVAQKIWCRASLKQTWHDYEPENVIKLLSGERLGWWSAQKFDKRVRMRAQVQGVLNDARPRILLDTGANVSVISERLAKQRRLPEIRDHGRCYWKQHSPGKWFRQAKIHGKINNEKAILLLDTGAKVYTAFARKVGCYIDRSQSQECVGIGESVYTTEGRTRLKITLAGSLAYIFDIWVGDLSGQESILGMDFVVPAGIRLDLADGSLFLPDEIRIQLSGHRQLYNNKVQLVKLDQHLKLGVGESAELRVRLRRSGHDKLWVTWGGSVGAYRGERSG